MKYIKIAQVSFLVIILTLAIANTSNTSDDSNVFKWNYSGDNGPENWGNLSPEYP